MGADVLEAERRLTCGAAGGSSGTGVSVLILVASGDLVSSFSSAARYPRRAVVETWAELLAATATISESTASRIIISFLLSSLLSCDPGQGVNANTGDRGDRE